MEKTRHVVSKHKKDGAAALISKAISRQGGSLGVKKCITKKDQLRHTNKNVYALNSRYKMHKNFKKKMDKA